jgi:hypothetical protein
VRTTAVGTAQQSMPAKIINHHRKHHLAYTHACQYAQGFAIVRSCALHAHGHYKLEAQLIYDSGFDIEQTFLNKQAVYALRTYLHGLPLFRAFLFQQICYACDACVCGLPLFRAFLF